MNKPRPDWCPTVGDPNAPWPERCGVPTILARCRASGPSSSIAARSRLAIAAITSAATSGSSSPLDSRPA
jgi:hypothetical protein